MQTVGCASDSVCADLDGCDGFLAHFAPFFALLRLSRVERQFSQLGGLDDEEFFVIEGWGVALTPGVSPRCQATSRA